MTRFVALLSICALLTALPASADDVVSLTGAKLNNNNNWHSRLTHPYQAKEVPPISLANSGRLESLMRAGKLYLSLDDAIALALENNLDIEVQRYGFRLAQADLMRARAGGSARGVSTSVSSGSTSATGRTGTSDLGSGFSGGGGGGLSFDPAFTSSISWGHQTSPTINSFVTGTNAEVRTNKRFNFGISQGFITGTQATLGLNNLNQLSSSSRNDFNPATTSALSLQIVQPLLRGWGLGFNTRGITIAKNNIRISDITFRRQVINTVSNIVTLYWDLVSFNEDVKVRRQSLALSERLYGDIRKQVEIGTLAPIEIVRSEAEVAARQQELLVSETNVLQQETILKDALSRTGVASPGLSEARVIPTDRIRIPETEAIQPIQDLMARAMEQRPELAQGRIQMENANINIKASKNLMRPEINGFVTAQNNALAGDISSLPIVTQPGQPPQLRNPNAVDPFFVGGYGNILSQLFRRNFPDYSVGLQLNIPIRNRAAQAEVITNQLNLRQLELQQQGTANAVRVEVQNALIGVQQARARYQSAVKTRVLQEQTLDAEQKKYALGASTIFNVIFAQRDLSQAQAGEVSAMSAYSRARVALDRAVGATLEANNVQIDDAVKGSVARQPAQLPVLDPNNGGNGQSR